MSEWADSSSEYSMLALVLYIEYLKTRILIHSHIINIEREPVYDRVSASWNLNSAQLILLLTFIN